MLFSVQTAAERILLSKAYQVYHFPVADGTFDLNPTSSRDSAAVGEIGNSDIPLFQPGSKVCLNYNRYPELYVVLAVAYPRRSTDTAASSSAVTPPVEDVTTSLETATVSRSDSAGAATAKLGTVTASNADAETVSTSSLTQPTSSATAAVTATAKTKYLYLVLPNVAAKLKPKIDLVNAKVVYGEHLINPPVFAVNRVLRFPLQTKEADDAITLPVEIKKVVLNLGLDTMGGEREKDEWKYKFQHGTEWVPESVLMDLYEMTSAGALD